MVFILIDTTGNHLLGEIVLPRANVANVGNATLSNQIKDTTGNILQWFTIIFLKAMNKII